MLGQRALELPFDVFEKAIEVRFRARRVAPAQPPHDLAPLHFGPRVGCGMYVRGEQQHSHEGFDPLEEEVGGALQINGW